MSWWKPNIPHKADPVTTRDRDLADYEREAALCDLRKSLRRLNVVAEFRISSIIHQQESIK